MEMLMSNLNLKREWKIVSKEVSNLDTGLTMGSFSLPRESEVDCFIIEPISSEGKLGFLIKPIFKDPDITTPKGYLFKHEVSSKDYSSLNKRISLFKRYNSRSLRGSFGFISTKQALTIIDQLQGQVWLYERGHNPRRSGGLSLCINKENINVWKKILGPKVC